MKTHKEQFTEYLRNAWREGGRQQPWNDYLSEQEITRCDYCGRYGHRDEVTWNDATDMDYCFALKCQAEALADELNYDLEWTDHDGLPVIEVHNRGDAARIMDFSSTDFSSKEQRVVIWLDARAERQRRKPGR